MTRGYLRIENGPLAGKVVPLDEAGVQVGREPGCNLLLEGYTQVSRRHARVDWDGRRFLVFDTGSTNGVLLEGTKVQRAELLDGNRIQFGDCTALFTLQAPAGKIPVNIPQKLKPAQAWFRKRWDMFPGNKRQKSVIAGIAGLVLVLGLMGLRSNQSQYRTVPQPGGGGGSRAAREPSAPQAPVDNGNQGIAPVLQPVNGKIDPKALQNAKTSTVLIGHSEGNSYAMGSGFVLGNARQIVTNRHVVVDSRGNVSPVVIIFEAGTPRERQLNVPADHITLAPSSGKDGFFQDDLALIKLDGDQVPALPAGASEGLSETDEVYAIGFPHGTGTLTLNGDMPSVSVKATRVERLQRGQNDVVSVIQLGGTVTHGNSGGPVINNQGQVIGVISLGEEGTGMSYAIPMQFVNRLIGG